MAPPTRGLHGFAIAVLLLAISAVPVAAGPYSQVDELDGSRSDPNSSYEPGRWFCPINGQGSDVARESTESTAIGGFGSNRLSANTPRLRSVFERTRNPSAGAAPEAAPLNYGTSRPNCNACLRSQVQAYLVISGFVGPSALYTMTSGGNEFREGSDGLWMEAHARRAVPESGSSGGAVSMQGISLLAIWDTRYSMERMSFARNAPDPAISAFYAELAGDFVGLRSDVPRTPFVVIDDAPPQSEPGDDYSPRPVALWNDDPMRQRVEPAITTGSAYVISYQGPHFTYHAGSYAHDGGDPNLAAVPGGGDPGPPTFMQKVLKWVQRHPIISGIVAGAFTLLIAALVARTPGPGARSA